MSSTLRYNGYQGSVEFEDDHLVIRILHIDDLITTQIDSAAAAEKAFEELVDDYIATCALVGKEPSKPFKGSFNVRVSPELHKQVALAAADAGESMNSWIAVALNAHIERQRAGKTFGSYMEKGSAILEALFVPNRNLTYSVTRMISARSEKTHQAIAVTDQAWRQYAS
jgi:predicted HicB family RNase H-like nuclease